MKINHINANEDREPTMPKDAVLIAVDPPEGKYDYYYDGQGIVFFNARCKTGRNGVFGTLQLFLDFISNGYTMGVRLTEIGNQLRRGTL